MTNQLITYESERKFITSKDATVLETTTKNGVYCVWSGLCTLTQNQQYFASFNFSWKFDWKALRKHGTNGLSGHITVYSRDGWFEPTRIDVYLTENNQTMSKNIIPRGNCSNNLVSFKYSLIPHRIPIQEGKVLTQEEEASYDEMFFQSDQNDTILLIDGMKLYVNKAFLSFHSDFFRALFSSSFKEGQMDEIPIHDISYKDFGLVMSVVYPKVVFPNDKTVEKLLELADRFIMPSVIGHVEYHLLHNSRIGNEKMMWMADQYGMPKLMEKCIREMNTLEKAKKLKMSPEYQKLTKDAKSTILDRLMQLI